MVAGMEVGRRLRAREQPGQSWAEGKGVGRHPGMPEAWGEMQMMLMLPGHFLGVAQCLLSNSP